MFLIIDAQRNRKGTQLGSLRVAGFVCGFIVLCGSVFAQPLKLTIEQIDADALPVIRLKTFLEFDGLPVQQPGNGVYTLSDNGIPQVIDVECPDLAGINSIALVLDNSSSMAGGPFWALQAGVLRFIDSLRANDEACIIDFTNGGYVRQPFTLYKNLLRTSVQSMAANGATPLWFSAKLGLDQLAGRLGKKVCLVVTDGANNGPGTPDSVIAQALREGVIVYTVGFGNSKLSDEQLNELAVHTGGKYFRIFLEAEMAQVFDAIATELLSPYCTITYTAPSCADSIRNIHLEASYAGFTASADTSYRSPWRADTLALRVVAPPEVGPGGRINVYIELLPGMTTGVRSSFALNLRYDPAFLTVSPLLPITVGTISQNDVVNLSVVKPGLLHFSMDWQKFGLPSGNLVGVRFLAVDADSSRPVVLRIEDASITAGCPSVILTTPDTVEHCRCRRDINASIPHAALARSGDILRVPVTVPDTAFPVHGMFTAEITYDDSRFEVLNVEPSSAKAVLDWHIAAPGQLTVRGYPYAPPNGAPLFTVVYRMSRALAVETAAYTMPTPRIYSDCCPNAGPLLAGEALIDGICDKIVRYKNIPATVAQNVPNPANPTTVIPLTVLGNEETEVPVSIRCYDQLGRCTAIIAEGLYKPGKYRLAFDASALPSGVYAYVLVSGSYTESKRMTVLR